MDARIMQTLAITLLVTGLCIGGAAPAQAAYGHRLGGGAHYWTTVDDVDVRDVDEDGVSWYVSYQYWPGLLGLEIDVEGFDNGFAGVDDEVYQPQAYLLVGRVLYAAAGIGGYYIDDDFEGDPFYGLRAGLNIPVLPYIRIDLNANYRFEEWEDLHEPARDIDTDTVTLGGAVYVAF